MGNDAKATTEETTEAIMKMPIAELGKLVNTKKLSTLQSLTAVFMSLPKKIEKEGASYLAKDPTVLTDKTLDLYRLQMDLFNTLAKHTKEDVTASLEEENEALKLQVAELKAESPGAAAA